MIFTEDISFANIINESAAILSRPYCVTQDLRVMDGLWLRRYVIKWTTEGFCNTKHPSQLILKNLNLVNLVRP